MPIFLLCSPYPPIQLQTLGRDGTPAGPARSALTQNSPATTILLQLEHDVDDPGAQTHLDDLRATGELDDAKDMELAKWVYLHVEGIWSDFNLIAEAVAKGYQITPRFKMDRRGVEAFNRRVAIEIGSG